MKYMGSKRRIAKYILPIMLKERKEGQWWVEPFVGGGNMIDKVDGKRLGADMNPYVIEALIAIRDHVEQLPKDNKEFTQEDYKKLKNNGDYIFKGYIGFIASFGGKWLGGWARNGTGRDYIKNGYRNACKQSPLLQGVVLKNKDYLELEIPDNSLIYCDPPYADVTGYKETKFNHDVFWQWCREMSLKGHTVFVSEYNAPEDFECLWEMRILNFINPQKTNPTEKLFRYSDI